MAIVFLLLVVVCSAVLGFIILVQNPKGGGLSGTVGGLSNQFMGVKQTTDVLEKGTWIFAAIVALLCLFSAAFIPHSTTKSNNLLEQLNTKPSATAPANQNTVPITPVPAQKTPAK